MTREGFGLALLLVIYGALLFADIFGQIANDLRSHAVQADGFSAPDNAEATVRNPLGRSASANSGSVSHFSVSVLRGFREGSV